MHSASPTQVVRGLEAIIDAAAGVLAEQSLTATLNGMARALGAIVPFTSLAIYEADHRARVLVPVFAVGRYVEQTLADRPPFDASIGGSVVRCAGAWSTSNRPSRASAATRSPTRRRDEPEAMVVVPLVVADDVIGTLNVWREGPKPPFEPAEAQLILRFATLAALAYANAQQLELLREQALTDALTGLPNRRHFHERLQAEVARAVREGARVSLLLLDVDDFKSINDRYGHPAGDAALRGFAALLRDEVRVSDVACRIGGEEFAVLLPSTTGRGDALCGARPARLPLQRPRPDGAALTASAGVADTRGRRPRGRRAPARRRRPPARGEGRGQGPGRVRPGRGRLTALSPPDR